MYNYIYCVQAIKKGTNELTTAKIIIPSTMQGSQNCWFGEAAINFCRKFNEKSYNGYYAIISVIYVGCKEGD